MMAREEIKHDNINILWKSVCNKYLKLFCDKHDYDYEEAKNSWVANDVGGIVLIGDYYVSINTIRTDIDMNAPEEEFIKWYDYCLDAHEFNIVQPNFDSWLRGCPITSEQTFERLRSIKKDLEEAIKQEQRY